MFVSFGILSASVYKFIVNQESHEKEANKTVTKQEALDMLDNLENNDNIGFRHLKQVIECCNKYIDITKYKRDDYCFKTADNCIVIMRKRSNTRTNEKRNGVVNTKYAYFRADGLDVIAIIDITTLSSKDAAISNMNSNCVYRVGEYITPNRYNENIDSVYTCGIHYFKEITPAFFRGHDNRIYSGHCYEWLDDGAIISKFYRYHGRIIGVWNDFGRNEH